MKRFATTTCIVAPIAAAFMMFATAESALASAGHNGAGGMTGVSHIPSIQTPSPSGTSASAFHLAVRQIALHIQSSTSTRAVKSDVKTATARTVAHTTASSSDAAKTSSASSKPVTQTAMVEGSHAVTSSTTKSAASSGSNQQKGLTDSCSSPNMRPVGCKPPPTHVFDFSDFVALGHGVATGAVATASVADTAAHGVAHAAVWLYNGNVQDFKDWGHLIGAGAEATGGGISTAAKAVGSSASFVASTTASAAKSVYHFVGGLF